jgi:hypothetical protein
MKKWIMNGLMIAACAPIAAITVIAEWLTDRERLRAINKRRAEAGEPPYADLMEFYCERANAIEPAPSSRSYEPHEPHRLAISDAAVMTDAEDCARQLRELASKPETPGVHAAPIDASS